MPIAQIHLIEGRTEAQKQAVIEKVTQALIDAVGAPQESVRVLIHDVPAENWGIAGTSAKSRGRGKAMPPSDSTVPDASAVSAQLSRRLAPPSRNGRN
ncbi:MAG: 4-oxalocrotonate tautomerase family protein [Proteobacteria bacterium]|nr:4-oxalocrotonate tautomerase family protein [Pseudomonadota bacterium]